MATTAASQETALLINPAFLQEIKDSNPDLWQTCEQLRQVCRSQREPDQVIGQLVSTLSSLRDQLALQFALEETYGYQTVKGTNRILASVVATELIQKARDEHPVLYLQASELAERAEELQYRGVEVTELVALINSICDFDQAFHDHEDLENELIEQSFDLV